ncbi:NAD(P)-dependent alcohol dehydrogenase [Flavihumibacter sp. CACIAM 22H1]|uniref:NAD(P)-dependent alcohol dehydrogenase n=1 Tax=Flavihumibacter sp. CACIAM 22H1 TaxID=1812911 RepID=UPI000B330DFE|nr:NAD(P)-dependent alcohol dehydrogenase [Flavihumibacter sp. CACIAM 22H1]
MQKMKAAVCRQYGAPEVLQIQEVKKPVCRNDEILVRIMASSVNSGDVKLRSLAVSGLQKIVMQMVLGFSRPRRSVLGMVYAGMVVDTGKKVSRFKVGDRVFGMTGFSFGAYAEYINVKENSIVLTMPANAGFEQAAALPFGWHTAIYFFEKAGINASKRASILVYGASGSVGTAAVQLAHYFNAELTSVCSSAGKDLLQGLGATSIICYDQEDFTQCQKKFDLVFDAVGKISRQSCKHLLNQGGRFVTVGGLDMAGQKLSHLQLIRELFEKGKCQAVIDKVYPFNEIVAANRYVDSGKKKGNVVLLLNE